VVERLARTLFELPLTGAGGEPISFARTVYSHGCARLPPATIEPKPLRYRRALRIGNDIVELVMSQRNDKLVVQSATALRKGDVALAESVVATMFRLNDDLAPFYQLVQGDPLLGWAAGGAGRLMASPTVFEDAIKTICTTNCAWSATVRMTTALVALGGGAFPEPALLASTKDAWFRDVARMGYRGAYISSIARDVDSGSVNLEALRSPLSYDDEAAEELLLSLPGIGPYGVAHVMQLLGRHRRLVLDSWTRPKFLQLSGKRQATDRTIGRTFARYKEYAGLAFWLYLTRDWVEEA
jgi:3-methyladenine DNA glycosylase/8-oxoguanine DNA glycosylase